MIEIAKESQDKFHCVFFGYSDVYSHLIEQAGFEFRRIDLPPLIVPITELVQRVQPVQAAPQAQLEPGDDILVHCAV